MKAYQDASLAPARRAKALLEEMTLAEKVGQLNQRLYGFRIYERKCVNGEDTIELSEEFRQEVEKYSGLGVLYGLYRADPWADKDYETGLTGVLSKKAYNQVQRYVLEHSRLGIPVMMSSECPHGHQALDGYLLPVNLLAGATFDPAMVRAAYRVSGRQLQNMGIRVVMLTGDNQRTADAIGRQAGVDEVIAGVLPDGKEAVIRQLQASGKVAMVGDGINDAPALTRADTGIAIGAGTDVAIDAADVVLMNSKLSDVPAAIRLSRAALRNIHENLFWAFIYNIIGIPLAAGVFIPFGLTLNPMFGAAAMSLSSFCVVSNALRLNLFDVHSTKHDRAAKNAASLPAVSAQPAAVANKESTKEDTAMKKTLKVEGMMCGHCEARVKKALEALPEVDEAVVSHETGTAIVTLNAEVADDVLKKAVEDQDYPVTGIQ